MSETLQWIDSHAHIDADEFDVDRDEMILRSKAAGVIGILNIVLAPNEARIKKSFSLAQAYPHIKLSLGVHPHDAKLFNLDVLESLKHLFEHPSIRAVGEVGLDYYYNHSSKSEQIPCFESFCALAIEKKLPISIHTREAFEDTYHVLKKLNVNEHVKTVIHCFSGQVHEAKAFLDLGCYLSFSGIATFKKASNVFEAIKLVPQERMLIETDCPFLAPMPHRSKRNEPAFVPLVANAISEIKSLSLQDVSKFSTQNAIDVFHFDR